MAYYNSKYNDQNIVKIPDYIFEIINGTIDNKNHTTEIKINNQVKLLLDLKYDNLNDYNTLNVYYNTCSSRNPNSINPIFSDFEVYEIKTKNHLLYENPEKYIETTLQTYHKELDHLSFHPFAFDQLNIDQQRFHICLRHQGRIAPLYGNTRLDFDEQALCVMYIKNSYLTGDQTKEYLTAITISKNSTLVSNSITLDGNIIGSNFIAGLAIDPFQKISPIIDEHPHGLKLYIKNNLPPIRIFNEVVDNDGYWLGKPNLYLTYLRTILAKSTNKNGVLFIGDPYYEYNDKLVVGYLK